jgi:class 3 adenylate cyclase
MADALELHMRFSNQALIDRIRRGGTDQAKEFQLTVAFGDAAGYTSWSQKRTPNEVFSTLSRYFSCIGSITVHGFQGIIDKFIGDGIMTHFGLLRERSDPSSPDPESARDALRAIITTQLALRLLSQAIRIFDQRDPLAYRFGIASGRCLVGAVGARDVMLDYSVIGNVVNLASRLEHLAPVGGLLIDRFTHIDSGPDFLDVVDGGEQSIKGVSVPIQVFYVRGFTSPEEREQTRAFLLERFFTDDRLDALALSGHGSREARMALRDFLARELKERPELPVPRGPARTL